MVVWEWPNWQALLLKIDLTIRRLTLKSPEARNSQAKNYKHDQLLSTPTNINRSEPSSTKGNAASEPRLECWKVEHAAVAPGGKEALTVIVVDVDGGHVAVAQRAGVHQPVEQSTMIQVA
jgi:hypothetical protein